MRRDRIIINKDMIPYIFSIPLNSTMYMLEIRYNETCDLFTVGLYDRNRKLICIEPIIYGAELFAPQYQAGVYPAIRIVPVDESNNTSVVTWDNFGEKVFLIIDNVG